MAKLDVPDLRTKELLTIIALAEQGSFVAAAAHLKTSQPALTRTVKRVERVLGVLLFSRNTRRVEITPAGREFVAVAERMLNDLKIASRSLGEISGEQRGRITIATYSAFASQALPSLAKQFLATRPAVELQIKEGLQWDILEHVRNGSADFGVGLADAVQEPFSAEPIFRDPLWVALPAGHRLTKTKRTTVALPELKGESLVTVPTDTHVRRLLESSAGNAGFALKYSIVVAQFPTMISHVQAGIGPAILPLSVLPPKPWRDFEAYPLSEPQILLRGAIITLQGRYLAPASSALVSLIRERCRDAVPAA